MATAGEVFAAMAEAVKGNGGKSIQRKLKGTVLFEITDINEKYALDLKSSECSVTKGDGDMDKPDLIVMVNSENMAKLISGELKPQQAFMKGKLKVKGKMGLAMKLTSVLVATRSKMPKSKL
mmetsp:Transcript_10798/g.15227  ORF Transcript_10798/g.15227 Transcript_10798/m.15227 type:complete len:122 (+) Transcript_10798:53-418(+)